MLFDFALQPHQEEMLAVASDVVLAALGVVEEDIGRVKLMAKLTLVAPAGFEDFLDVLDSMVLVLQLEVFLFLLLKSLPLLFDCVDVPLLVFQEVLQLLINLRLCPCSNIVRVGLLAL